MLHPYRHPLLRWSWSAQGILLPAVTTMMKPPPNYWIVSPGPCLQRAILLIPTAPTLNSATVTIPPGGGIKAAPNLSLATMNTIPPEQPVISNTLALHLLTMPIIGATGAFTP